MVYMCWWQQCCSNSRLCLLGIEFNMQLQSFICNVLFDCVQTNYSEVWWIKWSKITPIAIIVESNDLASAQHLVSALFAWSVWGLCCLRAGVSASDRASVTWDLIAVVMSEFIIIFDLSHAICSYICICSAHYTCIGIWVHDNVFIALS